MYNSLYTLFVYVLRIHVRVLRTYVFIKPYFVMILLIVAIIAAIDDMLDPILIISAAVILRFSLAGTTISQPGCTFAP